jgi:hypothetical protein
MVEPLADTVRAQRAAAQAKHARRAASNPLWLTIAVGQLNRLQGADFLLAGARPERLADTQIAGYLKDWAARGGERHARRCFPPTMIKLSGPRDLPRILALQRCRPKNNLSKDRFYAGSQTKRCID